MSEANGYVGADFFLAPFERRYRDVPLPGGKKARIRNLTDLERAGYQAKLFDADTNRVKPEARVKFVALCLVNGDDSLMFRWNEEARNQLISRDAGLINLLYDACIEHCGLGIVATKEIEADFPEAASCTTSSP